MSERPRSSLARGTAFEDRAFAGIQRELAEDRLGLSPKAARLFRNKGYFSRDRDANVIVDISIEVWLPEAPNWSLLWAAECKDYSGSVPVCDVEEFKSKLDQIAGVNKKGVMVVSSALQSAALSYARAQGITVVRLLADNRIQYVLHEVPQGATAEDIDHALTSPDILGTNRSLYGESAGHGCRNWREVLTHSLSETLDDK